MLTDAPPEGAGPVSVSVTVADCPDCTVDGLIEMLLSEIAVGGSGVTVTLVAWLEPP